MLVGNERQSPSPLTGDTVPQDPTVLTWNLINRALQTWGFQARHPLTVEMVGKRRFLLSPKLPPNNPKKLNP